MVGYLEITYGPMFAGKTSHLIERVNNFITFNEIHKNKTPKVLIINSKKDIRDLKQIKNLTTHNKYQDYHFPDCVESFSVENLCDIEEDNLKKYDYLAIDESQFFKDLKEFVDKCLKIDKYIHCTGLLSDSDKKPFGQLYLLIPYADEVKQIKAFCTHCRYWHKNAVFTKCIGTNKKNQCIEIGAEGKYIPVCGKHY